MDGLSPRSMFLVMRRGRLTKVVWVSSLYIGHSCRHIPHCHSNINKKLKIYGPCWLNRPKYASLGEIKVSDRYKLMDAIPTIKTIDDNDVSQIRSGITNLNSIFVRRLQELFITKAASEIYFQDISAEARLEKMVSLAKTTISALAHSDIEE